jgi:protein involved in polysaccharide export with SLBB domain
MVGGCAAVPKPEPLALVRAVEEKERDSAEYQLHRGDALDIKFFYTPELNESVTVRPDGKISLQLIGEVDTVGLTPWHLARTLRERYTGILVNPEVAVLVRRFAGQKAYVGGEVDKPGLISFDGRLTLLQALIQVGWLKKSAELRNVVILRNSGSEVPTTLFVDLRQLIRKPAEAKEMVLQPFDVVYVPKSTVAKLNDFVEQYIDKLIPVARMLGFSFVYNLTPSVAVEGK